MTVTDAAARPIGVRATLTTAGLLAASTFLVGVNSNGTRAGLLAVLTVLVATIVFARAAKKGTLPRTLNATPALLLMALLAVLSAFSVGWSLLPEASMHDALRLVSYTCALALAALVAQRHQERAREVALGVALAALIVSIYALGSRCFPGLFSADDAFARLRLPFGYWNAVGTVSAIGLMLWIWAASSRAAGRALEVAAYPAGGLTLAALMLSGSRGAIVALFVGVVCWLLVVPRRLRSAVHIGAVAVVGALLVAWAFGRTALVTDNVPLAEREAVGWKLLIALLLMTLALTAIGTLLRRRRLVRPLTNDQRRKYGRLLLVAAIVLPLLAVTFGTDRGLATIGDGAKGLFGDQAAVPSNSPSRLTQTASLRGRYWHESWAIFKAHPLHGTGADSFEVARLPYRPDAATAAHAHGMVPQTAADFGLLGLLVLLALALTWLTAAARLAGAAFKPPWRWLTKPDEDRLAALALTACALVFGVHSAVDWVWFLPAVAYFGLVCGGWTLGTPAAHPAWLAESQESTAQVSDKTRTLTAVAITVVGLLLAYGVYQPVRASQKVGSGLHVAQTDPDEALELGRAALALDPTSAHAQMLIATAQNNADRPRAAEHTLLALVRQQPGNPEAWLRLAQFRLTQLHDPDGAIEALRPIFYTTQHYTAAHNLLAAARTAKAYEALERIAEKKRRELRRQLTVLEKLQKQP